MRRKDRQITDPHTIERILQGGTICRLGLVEGDRAIIVPLSYGYRNQALYFHSARKGHKIDLLKKAASVCFEIEEVKGLQQEDNACDWSIHYRSVIGWGQVRFVEDFAEKIQALDILMQQHGGPVGAYPTAQLEATTVFVLEIDEFTAKGNF